MKKYISFFGFIALAFSLKAQSVSTDFSALEKTHDSLMAKVKSFVSMTNSEINSLVKSTSAYSVQVNTENEGKVRSYIGKMQKDSVYIRSVLLRTDSLAESLRLHKKRLETAGDDLKKEEAGIKQAAAEFKKSAKDTTISEQSKKEAAVKLEKRKTQLEMNDEILKALNGQHSNHAGQLADYIESINEEKGVLKNYVKDLARMRAQLIKLEKERIEKEKREEEEALKKKKK